MKKNISTPVWFDLFQSACSYFKLNWLLYTVVIIFQASIRQEMRSTEIFCRNNVTYEINDLPYLFLYKLHKLLPSPQHRHL